MIQSLTSAKKNYRPPHSRLHMWIENIESSVSDETVERNDKTSEFLALDTDVNFFSSMLEHSFPATSASGKRGLPTALIEAIEPLNITRARLARALKSTNKQMNIQELKKFPGELSGAVLTSQLLVKTLGKTTQGIDKICNMQ